MPKDKIEELVIEILEPSFKEGEEIVEVNYLSKKGCWVIEVLIDKPDGVKLIDCERVNKYLGNKLDELDPIPHAYTLEVSSAGVERPLKNKQDFIRFKGSNIKIKTKELIGNSKHFEGQLSTVLGNSIIITEKKKEVEIELDNIAKANLKFTF